MIVILLHQKKYPHDHQNPLIFALKLPPRRTPCKPCIADVQCIEAPDNIIDGRANTARQGLSWQLARADSSAHAIAPVDKLALLAMVQLLEAP